MGGMPSKSYQAGTHILDGLRQVDFVAVVGPTAVGKTTLIRRAVAENPDFHMLVAGVSRPPRPGEKDGVDFHFDSKEDMQAKAERGEYVTVINGASGDLYSTAPEDYPADKIVIMAVLSEVMPLFRNLPYKSFRSIFILPPSWQQWQERLQSHGFSPEQLAPRLKEAKTSLQFALNDTGTLFVINDRLNAAAKEFIALALGQPLSKKFQTDPAGAKFLARDLLVRLAADS